MLAFAACTGSSVGVDDLAGDIEDARCDALVRCSGIADRATCDAAVNVDDAEIETIKTGIKNGTIKYDGDQAGDCIDQLGDRSCEFTGLHTENQCDGVFTGTVPAGGACSINLQCANQGECVITGTCDPETMCCTGTCMGSSNESPIGGPCDDDVHFCGTTAYCKPSATSGNPGTCAALIAGEGSACDAIDACVNPLYCNVNFQTEMGTCKKPSASNAACSRMDIIPCADSRDYCDATSLTCVRRIAPGGACSTTLPCVSYATCLSGSCVADLPLGAACTGSGADCAGDLDCINGTCQAQPAGMVCTL